MTITSTRICMQWSGKNYNTLPQNTKSATKYPKHTILKKVNIPQNIKSSTKYPDINMLLYSLKHHNNNRNMSIRKLL